MPKICTKCKIVKNESLFYRNSGKETLHSWCIECEREWTRVYNKNRPPTEAKRESHRKWVKNNTTRDKELKKNWLLKNRDKHLVSVKRWRQRNPEAISGIEKAWRLNNPEKIKAKNHLQRARKLMAEGGFSASEFQELKHRFGSTCLLCLKVEPEIKLTPDHVIPLSLGGNNYISNIQPLCKSCNSKKGSKTLDLRGNYAAV